MIESDKHHCSRLEEAFDLGWVSGRKHQALEAYSLGPRFECLFVEEEDRDVGLEKEAFDSPVGVSYHSLRSYMVDQEQFR